MTFENYKYMKPIPYGRQHINKADIQSVVEVLKSDYLTQGPRIENFEKKFAEYVNAKYAVAVSNGTAALHLANLALGTKKGNKIITTPITFAASANSVLYCGAEIDFVDINPDTFTMDLDKLEQKLTKAAMGEYAGVIPVDMAGYPVDTERLREICDKHGLWIITDASHSPGAYFTDSKNEVQMSGNGKYADLHTFSFHPVKHIATGEGGMITTNNKELYEKIKLLRTHGISKDPELLSENHGGWYYEMIELGYNYRLSDIQAALGISQLDRAKESVEKRNLIAEKYNEAFKNLPIKTPFVDKNVLHAYHLYIIKTDRRKELYDYLREHKIFAQVHYIPVHLLPFYKQKGRKKGDFPEAEKYYSQALSLPMYPTLTDEEQDFVIEKISRFYEK